MTGEGMGDQAAILDQERLAKAGVSVDLLREHGHSDAHTWNIAHRPTGSLRFQARINAARQQLETLFGELDALPATGYTGPTALLEIRENPRLLRAPSQRHIPFAEKSSACAHRASA